MKLSRISLFLKVREIITQQPLKLQVQTHLEAHGTRIKSVVDATKHFGVDTVILRNGKHI